MVNFFFVPPSSSDTRLGFRVELVAVAFAGTVLIIVANDLPSIGAGPRPYRASIPHQPGQSVPPA
jgi:hypothetical protein